MPSAAIGSESVAPPEIEEQLRLSSSCEPRDLESLRNKDNASLVIVPVPKWVLFLVAVLSFVTGSFDSVVAKVQNRQMLPRYKGGPDEYFEAPWFQTFTMYLGEWVIMGVYYFDVWYRKRQGRISRFEFPSSAASFAKPHCPPLWWIVPCCIDFISSTMINYAIVFAQPSIVQMLRNFNVIVTAILTCLYLRRALRIHQLYGVALITAGLVVTGLTAILHPDRGNNYGSSTATLGIIMSIVGTGLSAFQFVFEERLLRKYRCSSFEAVGWMGLYGSIIGGICMGIGQATGFEDSKGTFYQMSQHCTASTILILTNIAFVVAVAIFNACGLSITKLASGLLRTVIQTARTVSVWLICLAIGYEQFEGLQCAGLVLIALAVFVYNYNYTCDPQQNVIDRHLRKPLICWKLKHPDAPQDYVVDYNHTTGEQTAHQEE